MAHAQLLPCFHIRTSSNCVASTSDRCFVNLLTELVTAFVVVGAKADCTQRAKRASARWRLASHPWPRSTYGLSLANLCVGTDGTCSSSAMMIDAPMYNFSLVYDGGRERPSVWPAKRSETTLLQPKRAVRAIASPCYTESGSRRACRTHPRTGHKPSKAALVLCYSACPSSLFSPFTS